MHDQPQYSERRREALRAEVQKDLAAAESYAEQHGSFADLVRQYYRRSDGAVDDHHHR
jgi:hypothetical protein